MNRLVDPKEIIDSLNKCYLDYADWPITSNGAAIMNAFKYHMESDAGLRLTIAPETDKLGRYGFGVKKIEVVDDDLYLVWTLKWA